jgi:microcystin-dependent protein
MADPVTVNRSLAIPSTGSDVGSWGTVLNGNLNLIDTLFGAVTSISTNGGSITLTPAQLACGTISVSGALSAGAGLIFPAVQGWWSIENMTTGNFLLSAQSGAASEIIFIPQGEIIDVQINVNVARYRNLGRIGTYWDYASVSVPGWVTGCTKPPYLLCDGSGFSAATYPVLTSIIGTNITPDLRGRSRAMLNLGTNRITAVTGFNGDALFFGGGSQTSTLVTANLPQHTHSGTTGGDSPDHGHTLPSYATVSGQFAPGTGGAAQTAGQIAAGQLTGGANVRHAHAFTTDGGTGSNTAFSIMQPTTISGITLIRAA